MTLNGHDIAGVNGPGIINRALAGSDFVICKATEGKGFDDPLHDSFVAQVRAAGKRVGHYHYAWPENGGTVDAEHFLMRIAKTIGTGSTLWLDFEPFRTTAPESDWGAYVQEFAHVVHIATGTWPGLYSEDHHLNALTRTPEFAWIRETLGLWKAGVNNAYTGNPNKGPGNTYGFKRVLMYQWDSTGIDSDLFYGDGAAWDAIAVGSTQRSTGWGAVSVPYLARRKDGAVAYIGATGAKIVLDIARLRVLEDLGVQYGPTPEVADLYRSMDVGPWLMLVEQNGMST